ncbi:hypothetical protein EVAR_59494_1 [Eumeta japonica]|uniref:Uncharacterized protein n=1 Tax=Eumeta variegata TaxID=151549 RepID=A0A4C1YIV6_EUMVA|nr:hypothetical protein EVAR_59494_1 [Eumeta japonica]
MERALRKEMETRKRIFKAGPSYKATEDVSTPNETSAATTMAARCVISLFAFMLSCHVSGSLPPCDNYYVETFRSEDFTIEKYKIFQMQCHPNYDCSPSFVRYEFSREKIGEDEDSDLEEWTLISEAVSSRTFPPFCEETPVKLQIFEDNDGCDSHFRRLGYNTSATGWARVTPTSLYYVVPCRNPGLDSKDYEVCDAHFSSMNATDIKYFSTYYAKDTPRYFYSDPYKGKLCFFSIKGGLVSQGCYKKYTAAIVVSGCPKDHAKTDGNCQKLSSIG